MRARGVACSYTIFRVGGVHQLFGADCRTIKGHYTLAGTGVTLYKVGCCSPCFAATTLLFVADAISADLCAYA